MPQTGAKMIWSLYGLLRKPQLYIKNTYVLMYSILFFSKCRRVPKMSCKIEKRTVVKTKPESKCSRVPRQFCRKEDCSQKDVDENLYNNDPNCYYRNQIVSCFLHTFLNYIFAYVFAYVRVVFLPPFREGISGAGTKQRHSHVPLHVCTSAWSIHGGMHVHRFMGVLCVACMGA